MSKLEVVALLNDLIKTCENGELGFRYCAKHVRTPELAKVLVSLGNNCHQGACELQEYLLTLGSHTSSQTFSERRTSAALQRAWLSIRRLFSGNVNLALLQECKRGEDQAVCCYRKALLKPLPTPVRELVERQYRGAKLNNSRIRDLLVLEQVIWPASYFYHRTSSGVPYDPAWNLAVVNAKTKSGTPWNSIRR